MRAEDGQYDVVYETAELIEPDPFPEGLPVTPLRCLGAPGDPSAPAFPKLDASQRNSRSARCSATTRFGDLMSILAMQGFAGLILFSVLLLMALGLAIIFGQMGVINMAHGEFMILGAYMTYLCSHARPELRAGPHAPATSSSRWPWPSWSSGALGLLVEWAMIRHLYRAPARHAARDLGPSLIMQQAFRSIFGAREVSASTARMADGLASSRSRAIDSPDQRPVRRWASRC